MAALCFKVAAGPTGDLSFLRVYSGALKAGSRVLNVGRTKKENLPQLFRIFAKRREKIDKVLCGDIVAAVGLKSVQTGDTITDTHDMVLLERIEFPETVISMAIEPQSLADRGKLLSALSILARSDPTFEYYDNEETGQTLICGMGELHLEVMKHRLESEFRLQFRLGKPLVAYREAITRAAEAEGRLIRQSGGKRLFAVVMLRVEPFMPDPGEEHFKFVNACRESAIRSDFFPAIEESLRTARQSGGLGGYPIINVKVTLLDGEDHPEKSTEAAFEGAAALAFNRASEQAGPVLLEPIMKVEVVTPKEYYGAILGDLMARRATITRTALHGRNHVIMAEVPLAKMFGYATGVRSLSQGRASYSMEPCRHERMP